MQVLEASEVLLQKQFEATLREKFASGINHEPIELNIMHKGVPFLNFEVSRICLSGVHCPGEMLKQRSGVYV